MRSEESSSRASVAFGRALQLTNILKDIREDLDRGICWLPKDWLAAHWPDPHERWRRPSDARRLVALLDGSSASHALEIDRAFEYTLALPESQTGLRLFCLWPLFFAVLYAADARAQPGRVRARAGQADARDDLGRDGGDAEERHVRRRAARALSRAAGTPGRLECARWRLLCRPCRAGQGSPAPMAGRRLRPHVARPRRDRGRRRIDRVRRTVTSVDKTGRLVGKPGPHCMLRRRVTAHSPATPRDRQARLALDADHLKVCARSCHAESLLAAPFTGRMPVPFPPYTIERDFNLALGHKQHAAARVHAMPRRLRQGATPAAARALCRLPRAARCEDSDDGLQDVSSGRRAARRNRRS